MMDNKDYEVKADVKLDYKTKHYSVVITPSGCQYHVQEGQLDAILRNNGLSSVTQARKEGWKFKEAKNG